MVITELLAPELLLAEFEANDKNEALADLARRIAARNGDVELELLLKTLEERERQASTGLGEGVAIPHARIPGLRDMVAAFARSRRGVDWDAPDGAPAHLIVLLAGPAEQPGAYLKTLAGASRLLRDRDCRARLMSAPTADDILRILRDEEAHNGNGAKVA